MLGLKIVNLIFGMKIFGDFRDFVCLQRNSHCLSLANVSWRLVVFDLNLRNTYLQTDSKKS